VTAHGNIPSWQFGPRLQVHEYDGTEGNCDHITRSEVGLMPAVALAKLRGARGERPGEHEHYQGAKWAEFKSQIAPGIEHNLFITVDHGQEPKISEGSNRRDAAIELGHPYVPVEVRYFGHAERQGTLFERYQRGDREPGQ